MPTYCEKHRRFHEQAPTDLGGHWFCRDCRDEDEDAVYREALLREQLRRADEEMVRTAQAWAHYPMEGE